MLDGNDPWLLWLAFGVIGLATLLPRSSFIVAGHRVTLPGRVTQALRYAPAAALAALILPDVLLVNGQLAPFNPKLAAAAVVVAVALRWRNPWLPFMAGMAVLLGLRFWLG